MITRFCYPSKTAMLRSAHVLLNRQYHAASFDFPLSDPLVYDGPERACQAAASRLAHPAGGGQKLGGGYSRMGLLMTGVCQVPARHASAQLTLSTGDEGGEDGGAPGKTRRKPARVQTVGAVRSRLAKMAALQTISFICICRFPTLPPYTNFIT